MSTLNGAASSPVEIIFLGTGTSSSLPHVDCLTAGPDDKQCKPCLSTLTPEGKHNIRRNTSAVVRTTGKDGKRKTIVIDVGKNFQAAAIEWFPKYGLRTIDAVLITHSHADAMNGLDDLRVWTLRRAIQSHIDLYCSQTTFTEVQRAFPYLVSKEYASGGGDVPDFKWHIINDKVPFEITDTGIEVTPISVHHGRYFSILPPPGFAPTPESTLPSTPVSSTVNLTKLTNSPSPSPVKLLNPPNNKIVSGTEKVHPYLCFAFNIQNTLLYMADVSHIPEDAWNLISPQSPSRDKPFPVCVIDCLRIGSFTSHFGLVDAVEASRRIGALRTYFTGFSHELGHEEYITIGEVLGGGEVKAGVELTDGERRGIELVKGGKPIWARPAHDGLRVVVERKEGGEDVVRDDTYDGCK